MAGPKLLSLEAAVELLTVRKSRPTDTRITTVLDRLTDQSQRDEVAALVAAFWAPLPARHKATVGRAEPCGPGVQLALPGVV